MDPDETEEESEEDDDIDYDQHSLTHKFKIIVYEFNSTNMLYIFSEFILSGESSPNESRKRI